MVALFGWRHSEDSQSPDCHSSCNVHVKRREKEMISDNGMLKEEESMLFVHSLGGGQILRLMRAGIMVCVVVAVMVEVMLFLGANFLASY